MTKPPAAPWKRALVTGASSGIGATFARRLAASGADLVVVARRRDRLEALAEELSGRYGRQVEVMVADLTDPTQLATIEARLRDDARTVDLLVNNAGFGSRGDFVDVPVEQQDAMVRIHVVAVLRLTHAAVKGMVERGHGGVINVSSVSGVQALPHWTTYSSSKAFMTRFSKGLHEEVRDRGVNVLALQPGFTRTEFHSRAEFSQAAVPGPFWMSSEVVVDAALAALARGRPECIPGIAYRIAAFGARVTPWAVTRRLVEYAARRAAAAAAVGGPALSPTGEDRQDDADHHRHQQTGGDGRVDPDVAAPPGEVTG